MPPSAEELDRRGYWPITSPRIGPDRLDHSARPRDRDMIIRSALSEVPGRFVMTTSASRLPERTGSTALDACAAARSISARNASRAITARPSWASTSTVEEHCDARSSVMT